MIENELFLMIYLPCCKQHEGDIEHFYRDSDGNITVGRGHLVAYYKLNKKTYTNYYAWAEGENKARETLQPLLPYFQAPYEQVFADINEVMKMPFPHSANYYNSAIRLKFTGTQAIWERDVKQKLQSLRRISPPFTDPQVPFQIKLLMLDIAFQSGEGYLAKYPNKNLERATIYSYLRKAYTTLANRDWQQLKIYITDLRDPLIF